MPHTCNQYGFNNDNLLSFMIKKIIELHNNMFQRCVFAVLLINNNIAIFVNSLVQDSARCPPYRSDTNPSYYDPGLVIPYILLRA